MPDITMCLNEECKKKKVCYRFNAVPSNWQSYAKFGQGEGECKEFIPLYENAKVS